MEFDLNQEPLDLPNDSIFGLQTLLSELETAGGRIEGRIRQLEAVISRTRQRQIWRQNQNQTAPQTVVIPVPTTPVSEGIVLPIEGRMFEARKSAEKNNTHLIAKALGRETDAKSKRSFFDCNICLVMAREPVLTSCGHLFCWPCFYSCSYIGHSDVKECPVCNEIVTDKSIIPIYGNENVTTNNQKSRFEESTGLKVPPRPGAHRIEGLRQKLCNNRRAISSLTVRNFQLPTMFAATEERSQSLNGDGAPSMVERSSNSQHVRSQHMQTDGIQQLSRLLERSASFSSLSSALNSAMSSAERLFQDLEASINSHNTRRISRQSSNVFERDSISTLAAILQQESRTLNNAADIDSTVAQIGSPSRRTEQARISEVSNSTEVNSTAPNSSSSRRRREVPMSSDVEDDPLRNPIRRRLT